MITHGFTSTSLGSTSAMAKKSRSCVSSGTPCSTDAAAIRQSCGLLSIRYTSASGVPFGDDVVVRVDQVHALKLLELAQPVPHDQIVQRHLHHFAFGLGAGKLHGLGHQFVVEHDIGSHPRTPPNVHCSR